MNGLTKGDICDTESDDELYNLLSAELTRRIGEGSGRDVKDFLAKLNTLPIGLRAMASVYELDVSLSLDDLGWHFRNWHDLTLAEETLLGLRMLGAGDHANVFEEAIEVAKRHWEFIGSHEFCDTYTSSLAEEEFAPLNERMWRLQGLRDEAGCTIVSFWSSYARKHPEAVVD